MDATPDRRRHEQEDELDSTGKRTVLACDRMFEAGGIGGSGLGLPGEGGCVGCPGYRCGLYDLNIISLLVYVKLVCV